VVLTKTQSLHPGP